MPPIQGPHNCSSQYTSWSPGHNNSPDQVATRRQQGRYVSLMHTPPQHLTYNGDASGCADSNLHQLSSLRCDQLRSLMNDPVSARPVSNVVHFHGDVSITHHAGIEASACNSPLAALFMGLSHNNLSDVLSGEINKRLANGCHDRNSVQTLELLKKAFSEFCFDHQARTFIPGHGLNDLQTLYNAGGDRPPNPTTVIKLILNDIYRRTGFNEDILLSEQSDLCRKVAFIDITSDLIQIDENQTPSRNLDVRIQPPKLPDNLHPDNEINDESPHPKNPAILINSKATFQGKQLLERFTTSIESTSRIIRHMKFSSLQDRANNRYLSGELEFDWHPHLKQSFFRSFTTYFTDDLATPMVIAQTMHGYDNQSPDRGYRVTKTYRRATYLDEMITDAWLGNIKNLLGDAPLERLLPNYDNCPRVLIVTLPEYDDQQVDLDWHRDINLPCAGGEKIPYQLSALISREKSHKLAWLFDHDGLIYCADSLGKITQSGHHIPTLVGMPFPGSEDALAAASQSCTEEEQNTYHVTSQRIANLGKTSCLLIYHRKTED